MAEAGFFEQKRRSPTSLGIVILAHAAVLAAVILVKGPQFITDARGPLVVTPIEVPVDPPVDPPEPHKAEPQAQRQTFTTPPTPFDPPQTGPTTNTLPPVRINPDPPGTEITWTPPADPPVAPPVRRAAEYDSRYARDLQPNYPAPEIRAQRSGQVRVRITIAPSGRVSAVSKISATSDAFWEATERQALSRWRFRPATLDGRPIASSMTFTVHFRLDEA